jgi:hypothetical protein
VDAGPEAGPDAGVDGSLDAEPDAIVDPVPELELECPTSIDDDRLPYGFVGDELAIDGGLFVTGDVAAWNYGVVAEKCDEILPSPRYTLLDPTSQVTRFRPARPGSYHMVLTVTAPGGGRESCEFELPVQGRGLRVELCWDTSTSTDLDLYLHEPNDEAPWFPLDAISVNQGVRASPSCNGVNCTATYRDDFDTAYSVDWGYPDSPLDFCDPFSSEAGFYDLGFCPNPRASTDNNQRLVSGTAEVVQLDNPGDQDRFRIMVQNFSNLSADPRVYVYCGRAEAVFYSPGTPPGFVAPGDLGGLFRIGAMWRPGDVETWVDGDGTTVGCLVEPLYLNGDPDQGPYVTIDDPRY